MQPTPNSKQDNRLDEQIKYRVARPSHLNRLSQPTLDNSLICSWHLAEKDMVTPCILLSPCQPYDQDCEIIRPRLQLQLRNSPTQQLAGLTGPTASQTHAPLTFTVTRNVPPTHNRSPNRANVVATQSRVVADHSTCSRQVPRQILERSRVYQSMIRQFLGRMEVIPAKWPAVDGRRSLEWM
jgi:hypothetical protein